MHIFKIQAKRSSFLVAFAIRVGNVIDQDYRGSIATGREELPEVEVEQSGGRRRDPAAARALQVRASLRLAR